MESFDAWALKERCKSEITQLYDVWRIYISWYTVFLTFNVAALVFYRQLAGDSRGVDLRRVLIGVFFVIQNGCAIATSIMVGRFSVTANDSLKATMKKLAIVMPQPSASLEFLTAERPLIPRRLMHLGARFNVTGPLALGIIWLLLTVTRDSVAAQP